MKRFGIAVLSVVLMLCSCPAAKARNYEFRIKAGFNLGGTAPVPLPAEIRSIDTYSPSMSLMLGADVLRRVNDRWGVQAGVKMETKGMSTGARVKHYRITMNVSKGDGTGHMTGVFTGTVETKVKNAYLTLPISAVYDLTPRWRLNAGMFVSALLDGDFSGGAFNGTMREGDPTGEKIGVEKAVYDFSDNIRRLNWGFQIGADWKAYRQFSVFGDLSWAMNSIFEKNFESIGFDMYNIYFNVGFAYRF